MQFLGIRVTLANGSNVVRAVWRLTIGTKSAAFTAGETLTWAGSGVGVYLSDSGDNGTLYLTHTSGAEPSAGITLTGGSSGSTVVVSALVPTNFPDFAGNPPRFADSPQQGPILPGQFLFMLNEPVGVIGDAAQIARSSFQLSANWGGTTYNHTNAPQGVLAVISRGFTPVFGLVYPEAGDRLTADVVKQLAFQIDTLLGTLLTASRAKHAKSSDQSVTATTETDVTGMTALNFPTSPDGSRLYRVTYNLSLVKSTAAGLITSRLYVGANGNSSDGSGARIEGGTAREQAGASTDARHISVGDLIIQPAAGAKIGVSIQTSTNGVTVDGGTGEAQRTSFIEIEELFGTAAAAAIPSLQVLTKASPWANVSGEAALAYSYNALTGEVTLRGQTDTGGGSVSSGDDIVALANALPAVARPSVKLTFLSGGESFSIETDGTIKFRGPGGIPGVVSFNGLKYLAA